MTVMARERGVERLFMNKKVEKVCSKCKWFTFKRQPGSWAWCSKPGKEHQINGGPGKENCEEWE